MLLLYDARVHKSVSTLALGFDNLVEIIGPRREDQFSDVESRKYTEASHIRWRTDLRGKQ